MLNKLSVRAGNREQKRGFGQLYFSYVGFFPFTYLVNTKFSHLDRS
ncbi:MAG: hypothetical protein ACK57R_08175 [Dolichospermum sp.]